MVTGTSVHEVRLRLTYNLHDVMLTYNYISNAFTLEFYVTVNTKG